MKNNIRLFDCFTAKILGELYAKFPIKQDYESFNFATESCITDRGLQKDEELEDTVLYTFLFLEENGIISFDKTKAYQNGIFYQCGLTMRGLTLLKKEPKSVSKNKNIGEILVEKIKEQGIEKASIGLFGLFEGLL